MKRTDTDVTLLHKKSSILRLESILFNRVLGFLLIKSKVVSHIHGVVNKISEGGELLIFDINKNIERAIACEIFIQRHGIGRNPKKKSFVEESISSLEGVKEEFDGKFVDLEIASDLDKDTFEWWQRKMATFTEESLINSAT